jgi:energy-coupling factor transporter ATP-binding protein EcfA2
MGVRDSSTVSFGGGGGMTGPVSRWVEEVESRIASDHDACAVIVGYTGNGKSTLAQRLAGRFIERDSSRSLFVCLSSEEVWSALKDAGRGDLVIVDEGVEVAYSLDTMTSESRDFVRWLDVCRAKGVILLVLMANLRWLNARIREDRALWAFSVRSRGRGRLYRRVEADPMNLDGDGGGRFRAIGRFRFKPLVGPEWDAYMARKNARVVDYDPEKERVERRQRRRRRRKRDGVAET